MEVTFWGVRGSIPAPGPETNRYGGNTACVHVRAASGQNFVLDMGTGMHMLGRRWMGQEFGQGRGEAAVLLSHAHWDHMQGFPFFAPIYVPGNRFTVVGPSHSASALEEILEGQMNPNFSPIQTLKNLGATIELRPVADEESIRLGSVTLTGKMVPHGTTQVLAYRLEEGGRSMVYSSDAGYPPQGPAPDLLAHYAGADLLIHDCTYTPEDRARRMARGLSSIAEAADVAARSAVKHLVMFHYDQDYGDEQVDQLRDRCRALLDTTPAGRGVALTAAAEGLTLRI
jgi:phosphoribosyl 1,2-cyclic phosphodiesterase